MKRTLLLASHSTLASGTAEALRFFAGEDAAILTLNAYVDNQPVDQKIKTIFDQFDSDQEVIVLTDLLAGSVNQALYPYRTRAHTHIVTGMNLALGLAMLLEPTGDYMTPERVRHLVQDAKDNVVYMNEYTPEVSDDDE